MEMLSRRIIGRSASPGPRRAPASARRRLVPASADHRASDPACPLQDAARRVWRFGTQGGGTAMKASTADDAGAMVPAGKRARAPPSVSSPPTPPSTIASTPTPTSSADRPSAAPGPRRTRRGRRRPQPPEPNRIRRFGRAPPVNLTIPSDCTCGGAGGRLRRPSDGADSGQAYPPRHSR